MTDDSFEDAPDRGREHIELLRETIDRNRNLDWEDYRERCRFTLVDNGMVRVSPATERSDSDRAIERERDHVVELDGDVVVSCDCHTARRSRGRECRHMRAVEAHPRL